MFLGGGRNDKVREKRKKEEKKKAKIQRFGSSVDVFSHEPSDVWAVGTIRFPQEKRAAASTKSQRRASMMRRDTGATGKNARSSFIFCHGSRR